jgi:hypothetical protein
MNLHDQEIKSRPLLPQIPLNSPLRNRRKRRLGPSISLALRYESPRYRWADGEWVKR